MQVPAAAREAKLFGVIVLLSAVVFAGFARNYYLRPWFGTRPLSALAQWHGAVMTLWMLLFLVQAWLVRQRQLSLHRLSGLAGAALAALIVGLGIATIVAAIGRNVPGAGSLRVATLFVAYDGLSLLLFGALVGLGVARRSQPAIHRRLMLMALIALLPPAFGRLVAYVTHAHVEITVLLLVTVAVVACLIGDRLLSRRWHVALLAPGLTILGVNLLTYDTQVAT